MPGKNRLLLLCHEEITGEAKKVGGDINKMVHSFGLQFLHEEMGGG